VRSGQHDRSYDMSDSAKGWVIAIAIILMLGFLLMLIVDWPQGEELDCIYHWTTAPNGGKVLVCD